MIEVGLYSEDRTLHQLLSSALGEDFHLVRAADEESVSDLLSNDPCDVLIADLPFSHENIDKRIEYLRSLISLGVPAIIMADEGVYETFRSFIDHEAFGYCRRPPSIRDLKTLLKKAHQNSSLKRQLLRTEAQSEQFSGCDRLIGSSLQMRRVYQLIRNVANLNATVLVCGESGTGKELIARAIHNLGGRSSQPFVAISCGAIPETLMETELFGHANGAFTGAAGPHEGYLEAAGEGTLFFDEIGELSLLTQVKLLRVLQEMEFSRVGSTRIIPLRARLIFATNQDLPRSVAAGKFRQDLYYRINVMRIQAPPLHARLDDIPLMARSFLDRYSKIFGKPMDGIEPEAMDILLDSPWPGNVRELENVIQRAIIDAHGRMIRAEDLSLIRQEHSFDAHNNVLDMADYLPSGRFDKQLRDYKIKLALSAIRESNGNKTLAARSLGMSRAYLYRLISLAESDSSESRAGRLF